MTEPIAVVGMGCLFPEAATPDAFWDNLLQGRDCTSEMTAERMGLDPLLLYAPTKGVADRYYNLRGGFIRDFQFDPTGYRLPPALLAGLDVQFQWSLYAAREALRDTHTADTVEPTRRGLIL